MLLMDANTNLTGRNPAIDRAAKRLATLDLSQYPSCLSDDLRAQIEAHGWDVRDEPDGFQLVRKQ